MGNFPKKFGLWSSLVLLGILFITVVLFSGRRPTINNHLNQYIDSVQFYDKEWQLIQTAEFSSVRKKGFEPDGSASYLKLEFEVPASGEDAFYLGDIHSPISVDINGETVLIAGSMETRKNPIDHDKLSEFKAKPKNKFVIKLAIDRLTSRSLDFTSVSGFGVYRDLVAHVLAKRFITNYAYLGLSFIFIVLFFVGLVVYRYNLPIPGVLDISLVWICQAIISLNFSRFLSPLPIYPYFVAFGAAIWVFSSGFYFFFIAKMADRKTFRNILNSLGLMVMLAGVTISIVFIGKDYIGAVSVGLMLIYLVFALWIIALAVLSYQFFKNPITRLNSSLLAASVLIAIGQFNDILKQSYPSIFFHNISPYMYLFASILLLGFYLQFLQQLFAESRNNLKLAAVARTTKMLAHDVRKPFSMLQAILQLLGYKSQGVSRDDFIQKSIVEIKRAVNSVNGMLADVMNIGEEMNLKTKSISVQEIVHEALVENFAFNNRAAVSLHYQINCRHLLLVDPLKVNRVFSNIISNALDAMKEKGQIHFRAEEVHATMARIAIRNDNSYIPDSDRKKLFDAFFTSGKQNGTGLGLAIAKQMVKAHGGDIWCESSLEEGTEFSFTLPISEEVNESNLKLPSTPKEIEGLSSTFAITEDKHLQDEQALEQDISQALQGRKLKFMVVDDEPIYGNVIEKHLINTNDLYELIDFHFSESGELAIDLDSQISFDLILVDVDLSVGRMNGFETVKNIRKKNHKAVIAINSNRGMLEFGSEATAVGAQSFLPKPMVKSHLLKLLLSAARGTPKTDQN